MVRVGKRAIWGMVIGAIALFSAAGLAWAWRTLNPDLLAQGRAAYERGNWQEARGLATRRLDQAPDDPEAMRLLARTSARLGDTESAQALYGRIGHEAMQAEDFFLLGTGLIRQGRPDMGQAVLEQGLRADPDHGAIINELARRYAQEQQIDDAIKMARRLSQIPGWEARGGLILGLMLEEQHDSAGAAEAMERALRIDPQVRGFSTSVRDVCKLLGRILLKLGRAEEARAQLQRVLSMGPNAEASWLLSRALLQLGRLKAAEAALEQADDYSETHPTLAEAAPYTGAASCAHCHAANYRTQQASRHAKTYGTGGDLASIPLPDHPLRDPGDARVTHTLQRENGVISVTTHIEPSQELHALVEYAVGSGNRGLTMLARDDAGRARVLRMSLFDHNSRWGLTPNLPLHPGDPGELVGRGLSTDGLEKCLDCHVTERRATVDRKRVEAADHAIGCERCHGPGGNHLKAVELRFSDLAIAQPRRATAAQILKLCGQCHTSPPGEEPPPGEPMVARLQTVTMPQSRCYTQSQGALSCVSCHNPHRDAETSPAYYEAKCLACHSESPPQQDASDRAHPIELARDVRRVLCPVNAKQGCVKCHMPQVPNPAEQTSFTDHYIRVYPGQPSAE